MHESNRMRVANNMIRCARMSIDYHVTGCSFLENGKADKHDSAIGGGAPGIAPTPTGISVGYKKSIFLLLE